MKKILAYYFPTTVIFIDDRESFLKSIQFNLKDMLDPLIFTSKPREALNFIEDGRNVLDLDLNLFKRNLDLESKPEQSVASLNVDEIYRLLFKSDRYNLISRAVIDYDMPSINGLDLSERITDKNLYKILLTGAADEQLAIQAFNQGLINQFIQKHDLESISELKHSLRAGAEKYFSSLSDFILKNLNLEKLLKNKGFIAMFSALSDQHNIVEYYLFNSSGSYILFDADGNHYDLFVFSKEDLDEMILYAEDVNAPEGTLRDLKEYKKAVCYFNPEDQTLTNDSTKWKPYIQPIQPIEGLDGYYYVCKPNLIPIPRDSYISFNQYMSTLND